MSEEIKKPIYNIYTFRGELQASFDTFTAGFDWMSKQVDPDRYYGEWDNEKKEDKGDDT